MRVNALDHVEDDLNATFTYSLWFMPWMVVCMLWRSLVRPRMVSSSCRIFSVSPGDKRTINRQYGRSYGKCGSFKYTNVEVIEILHVKFMHL